MSQRCNTDVKRPSRAPALQHFNPPGQSSQTQANLDVKDYHVQR
eukprot:CAMPEP_0175995544 /NCGR_PEP_ID=MMETSP0108-20121206/55185_1 /TAXON_ID=195067 ORGANISM="Goniomonas pacifica, Strain CCMP1869" /NCGR_SAMPLE_ID=MMETSP0108 /ASSEMBLY_ACC=CAM_ASM_000204 /LENGTH=43 /DNA_ID= /DNA_START= /DNA_END= /DNA_ORIENTATION=